MHRQKRLLSHRRLLPQEDRYTKFQIVMQYLPDLDPETASRTFRRWIHDDIPLQKELRRMGYHASQKYFTAQQVDILHEFLGEP